MISIEKCDHCQEKYAIEKHGENHALYYGRCWCRHGYSLVYLVEPANNCNLEHLEYLLNLGLKQHRKDQEEK